MSRMSIGIICLLCVDTIAEPAGTVGSELTLSFQNGVGGYTGTTDIGIAQLQPSSRSTAAYVWVDNNGPTDDNQALVQFNGIFGDEPNQVPADAKIIQATLRIYLGTNTNAHSYKAVSFHQMLVPWNITSSWNSATWGGNGVQLDDIEARSEYDSIHIFGKTDHYYDVDVTPTLRSWVEGAGQYGWLIRMVWSDGYAYYTSHNGVIAQRPALIVTYDGDPDNRGPIINTPHEPSPDAVGLREPVLIDIEVEDANEDPLEVVFYGRKAPASNEPEFSVVLIPDTQFYSAEMHGATRQIFYRQTDWVVENHEELNIPFVLHMGDMVQSGDVKSGADNSIEWIIAAQAMYRLHRPDTTGLEEGIPYAVNIGNHDQEPIWRSSGTSTYFNRYFGVEHFSRYSYYGGHHGDNNDNHFYRFRTGGYDFIVISLEYHDPARDPLNTDLLEWADQLLKEHPNHRGIVISHHMVNPGYPATWSPYGEAIYEVLKDNHNLHLMLGGHVTGEGLRINTFEGNTVYALVQDYQGMPDGGNGFLRIMTFVPEQNEIRFKTYSPWIDEYLTEFSGEFSLPYDLGTVIPDFDELARFNDVESASRIRFPWLGLSADTEYEWYVKVSDGSKTTSSEKFSFRTADLPMGISIESVEAVSGGISVTYMRRQDEKLAWQYEVSSDLSDWSVLENVDEQIVDHPHGMQSVNIRIQSSLHSTLFWRINLSEAQ